jgi:hypothetical protein
VRITANRTQREPHHTYFRIVTIQSELPRNDVELRQSINRAGCSRRLSQTRCCMKKNSVSAGERRSSISRRARSVVAHYRELTGSQLRDLKIPDPKRRLGSRCQCVLGEGDGSSRTKMAHSDAPVVFHHDLITELNGR